MVSREWSPGSVLLCSHALLNISSVSTFFCPKSALLCLALIFSKFQPCCLWSITFWSISAHFSLALVQTCVAAPAQKPPPSLNLSGIALHTSINFCIAGVSLPHVREMLSTINTLIHVPGSEHTFRGASVSAMWAALQLGRTKGCVLTILMAARNQCRWNQAYF